MLWRAGHSLVVRQVSVGHVTVHDRVTLPVLPDHGDRVVRGAALRRAHRTRAAHQLGLHHVGWGALRGGELRILRHLNLR